MPANALAEHLDELENILDEMHAIARTQRATAAALDLDAAAWCGDEMGTVARVVALARSPRHATQCSLALTRQITNVKQSDFKCAWNTALGGCDAEDAVRTFGRVRARTLVGRVRRNQRPCQCTRAAETILKGEDAVKAVDV